ncbi:TetR/AcrR family transcriptional regulator [Pseudomonas gingeri]|uniref:TetR/AcrR family transcriptional regulator n=1 Tax=Pseudomonas gingeri TaxID=117681 RepID=A0A7Y7WBE5_9PSED|nr:TetR/AcrR family transcriptional regulator [Pseudomonas gingeri]NWB46279.1 TetR/AcrR family transcriptional regulator [Pseudomonas gingeri]
MPSQTSSKKNVSIHTPRLERGKQRVAELMAAAARVFAEQGYDAATMTEVAAQAQASIGSLYQYFPTKALLAQALHGAQLEVLRGRLESLAQQAPGLSPRQIAERILEELSLFLEENPAFIALAERRDIDKKAKAATRSGLLSLLTGLLAQAQPPLPAERHALTAVMLLELMKIAVSLKARESAEIAEGVVQTFKNMLGQHLDSL